MDKKSYIKYFLTFIFFQGLFILFPQILRSQSPSWVWAKSVHTLTTEFANDIAVDTVSGDVVTVGTYTGNLSGTSFGPTLSTIGGGFVAKFDVNGNVVWAFSIGNNADDGCNGVAISSAGNIYVTGYLIGAAEFKGTSVLSALLTSNHPLSKEMFIAKYNSAGQLQWVAQGGGFQNDEGYAVSLNSTKVFVTGYFTNSGIFYGKGNLSNVPTGSNSSNENMFVSCYDLSGNIQWESDAGSGQSCFGRDIIADNNGVYVTGDFKNDSIAMFNNVGGYAGSVLNSSGSKEDAFVMSLSLTGTFNWGKGIHSTNSDFGRGICQSGSNIYLTGSTSSNATFPGYSSNPIAVSASGLDLFIAQISTAGVTNWVRSEPGSNDEEGTSIAIDTSNTICVAGYFQSMLNFSGGTTITSTGGDDIFIANYNTLGSNVNWVMQAGAPGVDFPRGISVNTTGDVYAAGEYKNASVFGTYTLTADTLPNIFVAKIGCSPIGNNTITAVQTICVNQIPATLNGSTPTGGSATITYLWQQSPDSLTWATAIGTNNTKNYSPPSLTTTTYYRRIVTSGGSCPGSINSAGILIKVNPLPTVTANATATVVCLGSSVTLTGGGANTYTWSGGISDGVAFIPSSTQTYTVTGTDVNGCTNTATKTITVNPLPTVTANATATIVCVGTSVTLTGGGANTYTWSSGVSDGVAFVPPSTQTYTVTGTDVNGCTNTATKTITVNPLPTVTANATATTVCVGNGVTLTGGGASTYTWSSGVINGVAFVPPSTQTYTVTGTDVNGCTNTATKTITVNPLPTVTANATATVVCVGSSVILTGGGANTYTWSSGVSNGVAFVPPSTQTYTVTGTDVNGCTNTATKTITVNPLPTVTANATATTVCVGNSVTLTGGGASTYTWSSGVTNGLAFVPPSTQTYTVTGTDVNGCTNTATKTITVNPLPTVTANATATVVCVGSSVTLTGGGASTYTWSSGVINGVAFVPPSTQTYTVTGTDVNGCTNTATKTITVNPLPTVTANATATIVCAGTSVTLTGGGASTYTWSSGVINGVAFAPPSTQTYTVTGTDVNGCTNSATKTITVNPLPTVTANATATTVCVGTSVTLTGGGATTYTWSSGVSDGVAFIPSSTQTYTVTGTDLNGCTNSATKTITVNPLPTVTANATATTVCVGNSVTLTGGGANTYTWSNGVSDGVAFVPPTTQTYTVTGTDVNGCTNSATKTITVNPLPTISANASLDSVCAGSSTTLTGGGANTYTWSSGISNGIAFVPPSTQTYTVTGTDVNGCTNTATKTITVNPLPIVTANASSDSVCAGSSITLTGGGASSYTWSGGVSNGAAFVPPSTQTYTVTGTDVNGCTNTATKTIMVNPLPIVTANATATTVCAGNSVTLTGGGASTYTWNSGVSNGVAFVPSSTQTYTVTGTDVNGCTNTATKTITVNPLPTVTANATATVVCAGSSVTLTGGGANTYTWSGGISNGVAFISSSTQTYTVIGTDVNGCTNTATKTITVNPLPTVTANATATIVCVGTSVTLTGGGANTYTWSSGVSNGVAFIPSSTQTYMVTGTDVNGCSNSAIKTIVVNSLPTVTANTSSNSVCTGSNLTLTGGGANTYTWSNGVLNGIAFVPPVTQTYTVTGTDVNGCTNSSTITIAVNPLPTVTANATANTICTGSNVTLTGGGAITYTWSSGISDGITFIISATQTYTVTGTDVNGCTNTATKTITVDLQPSVSDAGPNQNLCTSSSTTLFANTPTIGTGTWSTLSGNGIITTTNSPTSGVTGLSTGQTIFMWTISNGTCPASTSTVSIKVDTLPTTADAGPDVLIYTPSTNLNANTPLIGSGIWSMISGGGIISNNTNPSSQVTELQFGQNIFYWTISNGACPASADEVIITVHELVIPNGFSPNGDNVNDYFEIPGLSQYTNVKLDVFNRWGNLVYQSNDYKNDWSGKNTAGEDLTDDTYYFTLEISGKKTYKGYVVLKRK